MNWSSYQQAIFKAIAETNDSLVIEAVAGSGKTSTIVEGIKHVKPEKSVLFLAFNKSIADTLQSRIAAPAKAMTLHSCGFSAWKQLVGSSVKVDGNKVNKLIRENLTWEQRKKNPGLAKLVSLAKQSGIVPDRAQIVYGEFSAPVDDGLPDSVDEWKLAGIMEDSTVVWEGIKEQFEIDPDEADVSLARKILKLSNDLCGSEVDFDDMLYLPIVGSAPFRKFDVVFVDEAQDTNRLQREMISRLANVKKHDHGSYYAPEEYCGACEFPGGRVIAVGDRYQSIYAFRGASFDAMERMREMFDCKPLPLSITYRCPKAVVAKAQTWVKHIEHSENAVEGLVVESLREFRAESFKSSDVILCRITRPLVAMAFHLIRERVACRILGRDIGQGLVKLVERAKIAPQAPLSLFRSWLDSYQLREREKLLADHQDAKAAALDDRCETVRLFVTDLGPEATVDRLILEIQNLFQDNKNGCLTLSTVHKSKGLEFPRVFVLDAEQFMPPKWATDLQTERNLSYVAATRAQQELYYISSEVFGL